MTSEARSAERRCDTCTISKIVVGFLFFPSQIPPLRSGGMDRNFCFLVVVVVVLTGRWQFAESGMDVGTCKTVASEVSGKTLDT